MTSSSPSTPGSVGNSNNQISEPDFETPVVIDIRRRPGDPIRPSPRRRITPTRTGRQAEPTPRIIFGMVMNDVRITQIAMVIVTTILVFTNIIVSGTSPTFFLNIAILVSAGITAFLSFRCRNYITGYAFGAVAVLNVILLLIRL